MNQSEKIGLGLLGGAIVSMVGLVVAGTRGRAGTAPAGALLGGATGVVLAGSPLAAPVP
jgi:hypothetical protein